MGSRSCLGSAFGRFGLLLGGSWASLGWSWGALGRSWSGLGALWASSWASLGALGAYLGPPEGSRTLPGSILGGFWADLDPKKSNLEAQETLKKLSWRPQIFKHINFTGENHCCFRKVQHQFYIRKTVVFFNFEEPNIDD